DKYDTPNVWIFAAYKTIRKLATKKPNKPKNDETIITKKRKIDTIPCKDKLTNVYVATALVAIKTIIKGLASPARIAASPIISPPTTLSVEPIASGSLSPASLKNSNKRSINNASIGA